MDGRIIEGDFAKRADSACFWEAWVGAVLSRHGLTTTHHPFVVDGKDHGETWDLTVCSNSFAHTQTMVEVKSINTRFSHAGDYPHKKLLVCSQNNWLRKWPGRCTTQRHFLFVSRITGSIVWLPPGSKVSLGNECYDKTRGEFYKVVKTDSSNLKDLNAFIEKVK